MEVSWEDIQGAFKLFEVEFSDDVLPERCIMLCKQYSWQASDLCDEWLVWSKSKKGNVDSKSLEKMISDFEKSKASAPPPQKTPINVSQKRFSASIQSPSLATPQRSVNGNCLAASFADGTGSNPARVYKTGKRTGQVIAEHQGRKFQNVEPQAHKADKIEVEIVNDMEMAGRLQNRNRTEMNLAVLERLGRMKDSFPLGDKELKDISGGFLAEGDLVYGMLRPPKKPGLPLLLYGDYEVSRSSSTQVLPKFPVFPGEVVLSKVGNPAGQAWFLDEPTEPLLPPLPPQVHLTTSLKIIAVAGPYTTIDTLSYEPYHDFITKLVEEEPDIAILCGPFVDVNHKKLSTSLDRSFEEYFQQMISYLVNKLAGKHTRIYIVANFRENHETSRGFPTEKYSLPESAVTCLNDPAILEVNGIQIGVSSTDVFRSLRESFLNVDENIDINRLCARKLLEQRSFYPLYPPHGELCLRLPLLNYMMFDVRPHIFVLPATVTPFAWGEEQCLFINPGSLAKGMDAGSYATIEIGPFDGDSVLDFSKVKVVKI